MIIGGIVFLALIIVGALALSAADERACEARGGHIVSVYKGSLCVSPDGRIIE